MHIPTCWSGSSSTADYQFTPWQEIEVSNDGEEWEKRFFVENNPRGWYEVEYKWLSSMTDYFEFARPIDKIEPELPEVFDYVPKWELPTGSWKFIHDPDLQIKRLTTFCQALARQKTTK